MRAIVRLVNEAGVFMVIWTVIKQVNGAMAKRAGTPKGEK